MKRLITTFFFLIVMLLLVKAQNISGRLVDDQGKPLAYANVVLLSLPDSTFIDGAISDDKGSFVLTKDKRGQLLRISSVGYATIYYSSNNNELTDIELGILHMKSETQLLNEISVKGNLPNIRLKGDAMITSVSGSILELAGTAERLLDKIPNVTAHAGDVNVFGRGTPEIYINGRKIRDNSELDQLPSDNIKYVEVINNPGARYGSSVKAVIRIITKKNGGEGFGFNNRVVVQNHRYGWTYYDQFNINYRKGGLDIAGLLSGGHYNKSEGKTIVTNVHEKSHWMLYNDMKNQEKLSHLFTGILSMNYQFNDKHMLGVRYKLSREPKSTLDGEMMTDNYRNKKLLESSESLNDLFAQYTVHSGNFYYNGQVNDWHIDFNMDGMWQTSKENDFTEQSILDASGMRTDEDVNIYSWNRNLLNASKLIVSRPLFGGNLAFGGEYSHNSRMNSYNSEGSKAHNDYSEIEEGIVSSFLDYSVDFGNVNVQAGLRYEYVDFNYYYDGVYVPEQSKTYKDFFPSLSISWPIGDVQMQLSYSSDITRPSYRDLRSNVTYVNRYLYEKGDPFLLPTTTQSFTASASYKWIYLNLGFQHIKNDVSQYSSSYDKKNPSVSLFTVVNMPSYNLGYASLTLSPKIGIWQPQWSLNMEKQWYKAQSSDGEVELNHPVGTFDWQNTFSLSEDFYFGVNSTLRTRGHVQNSHIKAVQWGVDLLAYKSFCKDKYIVQIHVNDLFRTRENKITTYSGNRTMTWDYQKNSSFLLSFRYMFNSTKSKYKGTGAGAGQKSRM